MTMFFAETMQEGDLPGYGQLLSLFGARPPAKCFFIAGNDNESPNHLSDHLRVISEHRRG